MSKKGSAIDTLIGLTKTALDNAGRLLADSRRTQQQVQAQLETLRQYRQEYGQQLQLTLQQGIDPASLQNYRGFIGTLDAAIERAQNTFAQQQVKVEHSQKNWQEQRRKLNSYDTLLSRRADAARVLEGRAELRRSDEISARMRMQTHHAMRSSD